MEVGSNGISEVCFVPFTFSFYDLDLFFFISLTLDLESFHDMNLVWFPAILFKLPY